ncbi:alpha/beta hydrolase [Rhodococcus kroppenstedtii]|uniref:alpha/beta hydrolase n=1 Tax=Rhodococcoides kroppenstedtii TaxID=293050 RepID=UPI0029556DC4|nr:alpha/beta hydrolase [Rhodococcus kroppenstedtii]MDV7199055.1 alpha/beta hydrolase [Rhodococcus kroppenstedtii]
MWQAQDMWRRGRALMVAAVGLETVRDRVATTTRVAGWSGAAATAAAAESTTLVAGFDEAVSSLRRVEAVVADAGDERASLDRWGPPDADVLAELDARVAGALRQTVVDPGGSPRAERPDDGVAVDAADVLDAVLRARLAADRDSLREVERDLAAEVDRSFLGGVFTDADAGLAETRDRLAALEATLAVLALPGRRLVHYEQGPHRTTVAVAVGAVGSAGRVAVFVPGAGTTVGGDLAERDAETARIVADAGRRADSAIAGITWLGYEAPAWNAELVDPARSVSGLGPARAGAAALADALRALDLPRHDVDDGPRVSIVAHSYGTVLAAEALRDGGSADAVVLMGSPGWNDPPPDAPAPYVLEAATDPVADLGRFGTDPSELPTATVLATDGAVGHGAYLDEGSVSASNVAAVVAGTEVVRGSRSTDVADILRFLLRLW